MIYDSKTIQSWMVAYIVVKPTTRLESIFYFTMDQEKFGVSWPNYLDHLRSMMKGLMMNDEFSDVTLVTEDKKHINANIFILSTCSLVFRDIFLKNRNSNPIIYLRGVQYSELEPMIQFIYLGEASFYEERMDEFLAVAKSLQIKGLCNDESETEFELNFKPSACDSVRSENFEEETVMSDQIKIQEQQERPREDAQVKGRYDCDLCHKTYSLKGGLKIHKQSAHQGIKYACDQCDHQFTTKHSLTEHIQSKHEDVKHFCDQCDYVATTLTSTAKVLVSCSD